MRHARLKTNKTMKKQGIVGARRVGLLLIHLLHSSDEVRTIPMGQNARLAPNEKTMKNLPPKRTSDDPASPLSPVSSHPPPKNEHW